MSTIALRCPVGRGRGDIEGRRCGFAGMSDDQAAAKLDEYVDRATPAVIDALGEDNAARVLPIPPRRDADEGEAGVGGGQVEAGSAPSCWRAEEISGGVNCGTRRKHNDRHDDATRNRSP